MGRRRKSNLDYVLPAGVYRHGKRWRMRVYLGDDRRAAWHTFKADTSEKLYKEYARLLSRRGLMTMRDVFTQYQNREVPKKAAASQESDRAALKQLGAVFGTMRPQAIRRQHVVAYLDNRGAVAPVRANRERALLSHALTKCTHWGILDDNPILGLQYRNPEPPRTRYVTDAELFRAMRLAGPIIRYVMRLAYLTGLRRKDILAIEWHDLTEDGLHVTLSKSMLAGVAPKRLLFEWSPALRKVFGRISAIGAIGTTGQVFPFHVKTFARIWTRFQDRVEKRGGERFYLRDLRAKHATDAAARGLDATERLAHSSAATTRRHYTQRRPTRIKL